MSPMLRPCEPFADGSQYERVSVKRSRGQKHIVMSELNVFHMATTVIGLAEVEARVQQWLTGTP